MDFMVEMEIGVPPDLDAETLADLTRRERERAVEIFEAGDFFQQVWVVPGQRSRIMICSAADAKELHETFQSLPAFPWCRFKVSPLIGQAPGAPICPVD
ncbi:muconolactone Delta-isomerase [Sphingomonas sp.]|uniref:muconolactone Delta-isomerase n=1 Tax=Sphingomonas sp. TaxID=28214 RepID=UPI000DB013EA|nr:muconolactone Delta-isomerase family protein [Sphingomonas sp.]PZU09082.1 MAG: muconolactone delta-isomerase [Sphingomonas sp.]